MTKIYYKATRPDGTDFYSGTVDYAAALASGRPLERLTSPDGFYQCCSPTVYHAADVPAETLIGGSWPCRLFEVTGRPVDIEGHKFGFRSLRVRREIPAWQALGPNGQEVAALIERARRLGSREAAWTYAARSAARDAALGAARTAAMGAVTNAARGAAWDAAWALVVRDLISAEHFDILYGSWRAAIGEGA